MFSFSPKALPTAFASAALPYTDKLVSIYSSVYFLATCMAYGSSQARDQISAAAAAYAIAAAMLDP